MERKFKMIVGIAAMTAFFVLFAACKKENQSNFQDSDHMSLTLPLSRTGGYWVEHEVQGHRVYDASREIRCLEDSDICFSYYTWQEGNDRGVECHDCLLFFPKNDNVGEEPYPTNEFIHVTDFSYDENTGLLKFRVVE
jgi:hypothetical protein